MDLKGNHFKPGMISSGIKEINTCMWLGGVQIAQEKITLVFYFSCLLGQCNKIKRSLNISPSPTTSFKHPACHFRSVAQLLKSLLICRRNLSNLFPIASLQALLYQNPIYFYFFSIFYSKFGGDASVMESKKSSDTMV